MDKNKQEQIYRFVVQHKIDHDGLAPTLREIKEGCGISSTSVTEYNVQALIKKGLLFKGGERDERVARRLGVTGGRWMPPPEFHLGADVQPRETNETNDGHNHWHRCGDCGARLDIARPGRYQCPRCE